MLSARASRSAGVRLNIQRTKERSTPLLAPVAGWRLNPRSSSPARPRQTATPARCRPVGYLSIAQALGMNVTSVGRASWCKGPAIT
jgi:hypothetical protein